MDADLTVIAADPAEKIEALAEVVYTIRAGRVIFGAGARVAQRLHERECRRLR